MSERMICPTCGGSGEDMDLKGQCCVASCWSCDGDGSVEPGEEYDLADDDMDSWECAYPDRCLMAFADHLRSECHTVEDMEAYYSEALEQEQSL